VVSAADRWWLWVARLALRHLSDRAAWWLHTAMTEAYRQRPDLARGD
jgi:hypothetical protein